MLSHQEKNYTNEVFDKQQPSEQQLAASSKNNLWKNHRITIITLSILTVLFLIPSTTILAWLGISVFLTCLVAKKSKLNTKIKLFEFQPEDRFLAKLIFLAKIVLLFILFSAALFIPARAYLGFTNNEFNRDLSLLSIDKDKLNKQLEETKRMEERNLREQAELELEKAKLQQQISIATKINPEYDVESNLESQQSSDATAVNGSIATFDNSTKTKKLFEVTSVVDGDTIKISELGTLRLIGMDTPETKDPRKPVQCFGIEASNKARELLAGKKVYLEFDPAQRIDKYFRTLAYVYREDGYFYNKEMIKGGFAHSYVKYPHPKLEEFNQAQEEAKNNSRGFWANNTCGGDTSKSAVENDSNIQTIPPKVISNPENSKTDTLPPVKPIPEVKTPTIDKKIEPLPEQTLEQSNGFIPGTCTVLKERGLGNWLRGDVNYSSDRDRDNDGIACEL